MGPAGIFLDCVAQSHLAGRSGLIDREPLAVDGGGVGIGGSIALGHGTHVDIEAEQYPRASAGGAALASHGASPTTTTAVAKILAIICLPLPRTLLFYSPGRTVGAGSRPCVAPTPSFNKMALYGHSCTERGETVALVVSDSSSISEAFSSSGEIKVHIRRDLAKDHSRSRGSFTSTCSTAPRGRSPSRKGPKDSRMERAALSPKSSKVQAIL
jgi:hypothetical protein